MASRDHAADGAREGATKEALMPRPFELRGIKESSGTGVVYDVIFIMGDNSFEKSWQRGAEAALKDGRVYVPLGPDREQDRIIEALLPRLEGRQDAIVVTPETRSTETNVIVVKNILRTHLLPLKYRLDNGEPAEKVRVLIVTHEGQASRLRRHYLRADAEGMEHFEISYQVLMESLRGRLDHLVHELLFDERIARSQGGVVSSITEGASRLRTGSRGMVER